MPPYGHPFGTTTINRSTYLGKVVLHIWLAEPPVTLAYLCVYKWRRLRYLLAQAEDPLYALTSFKPPTNIHSFRYPSFPIRSYFLVLFYCAQD